MDRPSKAEIKAAIEKLKAKPSGNAPGGASPTNNTGKLSSKKNSQRIRKQGV